ncbi:DUF7848 domain-containing protein [Streptomyces sp. NPDC002643]
MTRAIYRFREHTLKPDATEPTLFALRCKGCGESSDGSEKAEEGSAWAEEHLKANPGHLAYQEHITRSYRFEPGKWL